VSLQNARGLWIKNATVPGCPILGAPLFLRLGWGTLFVVAAVATALPASAQYQGSIAKPDVNTPDLRAVAVLEWTGDEAHPKASRLIPVCIYDGQELEDAGIYMARPEPIALDTEVEYQLQQDGKPVGLFVVDSAGEQQGSWVGFGKMKPLPVAKPRPAQIAKIDADDDAQSDNPVLHRKHPPGNSGGGDSGSGSNGPPPDPDRPTLHKGGDSSSSGSGDSGNSSGSSSSSGSNTGSTSGSKSGSSQAPNDPDRPTLHKGGDASGNGSDSSDSGAAPPDPDRPTLHKSSDSSSDTSSSNSSGKSTNKNGEDEGYVEDVAKVTDPERPRLFRGKSQGYGGPVLPSLVGLPPDVEQRVAVSDAKNRAVHVWDYIWANPDDEDKMKSAMEDLARTALGLNPPAAPAKPTPKTATSAHKTTRPAAAPPPPAPLADEQFHVYELAYGSGATMVLSAHTTGAGAPIKFVTLVAQPDLYGGVSVLLKNVAVTGHLDETPRWRLVDAVDAMADNRGDLLFEQRGDTQRQFALYRVLRGQATRIFLSSSDAIGSASAGN
jgi:hypothetical protein